jgi:hypothetical protein
MLPNRVAAVAAAVISLALGVLPVIGNFDWTSTAGAIAGIVAVLTVTQKWLDGYQKHEQRDHEAVLFAQPEKEIPEPPKRKSTAKKKKSTAKN